MPTGIKIVEDIFTNIPIPPMFDEKEEQSLTTPSSARDITGLRTLSAGSGDKSLHVDRQGLWLGADKFEEAPLRIDMKGNIIFHSVEEKVDRMIIGDVE